MEPSTCRYFGVFELDLQSGELRRHGRPVRLPPQASTVLALLVERAGKLVSRDEIRLRVWHGEVVDFDQGVNNAVRQIRLALGDQAGSPTFLETVPRRGYRFIAPVQNAATSRSVAAIPPAKRRGWIALALGLAAVVLLSHPQPADLTDSSDQPWTLAVFPLTDLSRGTPQDFLAEGLAEELITELATLAPDRLRVIAHEATHQADRPAGSPAVLAKSLGLSHYLTGSIRREGEELRLAVRLLREADGECLWAESFDRQVNGLLVLEKEIGRRVSDALALELPTIELPEHPPSTAPEPRSREAYLKGRYHLNKNTAQAAAHSLPFFSQAVAENPSYAPAHAGLASAYLALPWRPRRITLARQAVERALELDGRLAEAHALRGELALQVDWQWQTAEEAFLLAIDLDPAALEPRAYYAYWLSTRGRHDEAIAQIHRTAALDPVLSVVRSDFAMVYFLARRFEAARETYARLLELEPDSVRALDGIFFSLLELGRFEEAKPWALHLLVAQGAAPEVVEAISAAAPEESAQLYLRWQLDGLLRMAERGNCYPAHIAGLHAQLGETEQALDWLERAFNERSSYMIRIGVAPELDALRGNQRFEALRRQVELVAAKRSISTS